MYVPSEMKCVVEIAVSWGMVWCMMHYAAV